jgi:signal peptidase II
MKRPILLFLFACALFLIDFFSKAYVHAHIPAMALSPPFFPYGGIAVFQNWYGIDFSINFVLNKGAAWGMFADFQYVLLYLRIAVIGAILGYVLFFNKNKSHSIPLTLIITGAIGNVIDTFRYGYVVDMFHLRFWSYSYPVFNVADSAIFCGIIWMLLLSLCSKAQAHKLC